MPCTRRSLAGAQIKATLFSTLQTALDEGYVGHGSLLHRMHLLVLPKAYWEYLAGGMAASLCWYGALEMSQYESAVS